MAVSGSVDDPSSFTSQQVEDVVVVGPRKVFRAWDSEIAGGFAGVYRAATGDLVVMHTDLSKANIAKTAILSKQPDNLLPSRRLGTGQVEVRQATFSYTQMLNWYTSAWPEIWDLQSVQYTTIDVPKNQIEVGIVSLAAETDVRHIFADLGVPQEAVDIQPASGVQSSSTTLRDKVRPIPGGVEIYANEPCSAGFNTVQGGSQWLLTASHCTYEVFGMSTGSAPFSQPNTSTSSNKFGDEVANAPKFSNCGAADLECAYADVAGIEYDDPTEADQGYIAKPTHWDSVLTLDPKHEWFEINEDDSVCTLEGNCAIVGDKLEKVGRTTGWTLGLVTDSCRDQQHDRDPNVTMICQGVVDAWASGGDSGAPVFEYIGPATPSGYEHVALRGILWGQLSSGEFIYSKMVAIDSAFGSVCAGPQCQVLQ